VPSIPLLASTAQSVLKRPLAFYARVALWWAGIGSLVVTLWVSANFGQLELAQFLYHVVNLFEVIRPMGFWFVVFSAFVLILGPLFLSWWLASLAYPSRTEAADSAKDSRLGWGRVRAALTSILVPTLVLGVASPAMASTVGVFSFISNSKPSTFVEQFYQAPDYIGQPQQPTNLVMIYVESLENTYRDEGLWGENLLDSLDRATEGWMEFSNFREVRGTGWTIAGIVASQCGVLLKDENPLNLRQFFGKNSINRIGENVDEFMPGITCLGDVLDEAGYANHFLGGADLEFAGKGKFFEGHGFDVVKGVDYWEALGETEFSKWGLYDDALLEHAKAELDSLHEAGRPFNLTVLTVDTHRPEGHISPTCAAQGVEEFTGVVECTSDLLADFVNHMAQKGYLDDTAVVITGDHLTMPNVVQDTIDLEPQRTIYNRMWTPLTVGQNREQMMHFSVMPTVLDMLGFTFPGSEMALGVSGVGPLDPGDLTIYTMKDLDDQLRRPSELYDVFWGSSQGPS
jgi:phosphoglycerol transferase